MTTPITNQTKTTSSLNSTDLMQACFDWDVELIRHLIENGVNINEVGKYGNALMHAIHQWNYFRRRPEDDQVYRSRFEQDAQNYLSTVKLLIDNGVNLNVHDNDGTTALMLVCRSRTGTQQTWESDEMYQFISELQQNNVLAIIKYMIKHGADINAVDSSDWNAIDYALNMDNKYIAKYFYNELNVTCPLCG